MKESGRFHFLIYFVNIEDTFHLEHFAEKYITVLKEAPSKSFIIHKDLCGVNYGLVQWIPSSDENKRKKNDKRAIQ